MNARDIAAEALGKPLPPGAIVHHANLNEHDNRNCNLVICQDREYHMLLHKRLRARGITRQSMGLPKMRERGRTFLLDRIPEDLWQAAKAKADSEGRKLKWVIVKYLTRYVKGEIEL